MTLKQQCKRKFQHEEEAMLVSKNIRRGDRELGLLNALRKIKAEFTFVNEHLIF